MHAQQSFEEASSTCEYCCVSDFADTWLFNLVLEECPQPASETMHLTEVFLQDNVGNLCYMFRLQPLGLCELVSHA